MASSDIRDWSRQGPGGTRFLCSTNSSYIQPQFINNALASNIMWWARGLEDENLEKMLQYCLCLGLYDVTPEQAEERKMIGMARVITDRVTFGYLTDVFVQPEYQGRGLGTWMMECLSDLLDQWRALRGFWLMAGDEKSQKLYESRLGVHPVGVYHRKPKDLVLLQRFGPASNEEQPGNGQRES